MVIRDIKGSPSAVAAAVMARVPDTDSFFWDDCFEVVRAASCALVLSGVPVNRSTLMVACLSPDVLSGMVGAIEAAMVGDDPPGLDGEAASLVSEDDVLFLEKWAGMPASDFSGAVAGLFDVLSTWPDPELDSGFMAYGHDGMSDGARKLVKWLTFSERGANGHLSESELDILVGPGQGMPAAEELYSAGVLDKSFFLFVNGQEWCFPFREWDEWVIGDGTVMDPDSGEPAEDFETEIFYLARRKSG